MRILVIVHAFPPLSKGGAETYAHAHACALAARGHQVAVVAREADASRAEYATRVERRDGLDITWINNTFRQTTSFAETYANPAIDAVVARHIDTFGPDVAHIHHLTCLSTGIVSELHARRVPIVFTLHDYWLMCHRGQLLDTDFRLCDGPGTGGCHSCLGPMAAIAPPAGAGRAFRAVTRNLPEAPARWLRRTALSVAVRASAGAIEERGAEAEQVRVDHMRACLSRVDRFLAPSDALRRRFVEFGAAADRIALWPYGMNRCAFERLPRTKAGRLRIGFLGSVMISKAPHVLLEAFASLPAGAATVDLFGDVTAYHGDDSYRSRLAPLLAQPGVTLHGAIPHAQVPAALAGIDVLAVPSIWPENSPLAIHEAFLAGIPVVASRIGGIPEALTDGVNGLLVEPGSIDAMRHALQRLLDEPALLATLSRGAASSAVRSIEDDAAATEKLYESLLPRKPVDAPSRLAAVVLHYRHPDETRLAVRSLLASPRPIDDLIVVDNDPEVRCADALADVRDRIVYLANDRNLGFSGGMNVGIREALRRSAARVLLVNSDVIVPPDGIAALERGLAADARLGAVGPLVLARTDPSVVATAGMSYRPPTGRMRHDFGEKDFGSPFSPPTAVDGISGCAMLVTRAALDGAGLFDEDYFFGFEDLDWCLRARVAGFMTAVVSSAVVHHEGGRAMGADSPRRLYYAARNHLRLASRQPAGASALRTASVIGLNLAHAVRAPGGTLGARLGAVLRGTRDHFKGRYGADASSTRSSAP
jgi:GT2 family glycosyltransferase/glycosyltransferase involved in cell wall biosynthesis